MNRLFVIAGLVILVVALVFINQGVNKAGQPDHDEDAPPPIAKSAPTTKVPATKVPGMTPAAGGDQLPAEQTVGDPATAKHKVVVGWSYNEASQQKPDTLAAPIKAVQEYAQKTGGTVSVEIVNTDVPVSDRSPAAQAVTKNGVFVDGKPVVSGDVSAAPPQKVVGAVQAATK